MRRDKIYKGHTDPNEDVSPEEVRAIIHELKRKSEEEFQEKLKKMTPEEREAALEWANDMD